MSTMTAPQARGLWKALIDNASHLVADAEVLLKRGSRGRARALVVLAQEELGKALWIYDEFQDAWSDGDDSARSVEMLRQHGRNHTRKYLEAVEFGTQLAQFWGDYSKVAVPADGESWDAFFDRQRAAAKAAARAANGAKQRGFYVDVDTTGVITTPANASDDDFEADLSKAAQVVEMLLICDHSRMKLDATTPYDSTHDQQFRLLAVSHPEEFRSLLSSSRHSEPESSDGAPTSSPAPP